MADILQEIVAHKRQEVQLFKEALSERALHRQVEKMMDAQEALPSLSGALSRSSTGIIAEFKRRSPSKGWIKAEGRADTIPLAYQQAGAAALSILTDRQYFGGDDRFISVARESGVALPVLYKNFIVDEYQLFQARLCGASAVLLIAACLPLDRCRTLLATAHELGLQVLLEMHSEAETDYAVLEPDLCGVNNRNLGTFHTDVQNSFRLASRLPEEAVWVSESGISSPATIGQLRLAGYRGFLVGETFMRTPDPGATLADFLSQLSPHSEGQGQPR